MSNDLTKAIQEARTPQELSDALDAVRQDARAVPERAPSAPQKKSTDNLTKALSEATSHQEIDQILHEGPSNSRTPRSADEPTKFTRTEKIGGKDFTFEASSELELERVVQGALKVASELQTPVPVEVDYHQAGRDAALRAAERAELELRFKRGELNTADYLEQSGAVKDYLEKQGVPLDELRQTVAENHYKAVEQSWADATTAFLNSGSDWPGGTKNKTILGLKLQELGLVDAEDKTAAIATAYAAMKAEGLVFANDGSAGGTARRSTALDLDRATPAEILEHWKSTQPSAEEANKNFSTLFGKGR